MHRLRKGKKGNKEEEDGVPPVPAATTSHNPFKWGRTPEPPPKPELDIEHALPPSDDFRTSLLMPNLAQRFSILQMEAAAAAAAAASGKMNGENFSVADGFVFSNPQLTPLREITETSSITESVTVEHNRLTTKSQESAASDESAGVMDRSRGGGGNVLFGGRQKVYRVPNAYTNSKDPADDSNPGSPMSGRVVYDYDLSETAFTASGRKREQHDSEDIGSPTSDSNGDNRNRYTNSSTGSAPTTITRSSTAATSVTSNSVGSGSIPASASTSSLATASGSMVANKPRRALYEQALDQLQDQQSAATGRLEKLASLRKASASPPPLANSQPLAGNFSSSEPGQRSSTSSPSSPATSQPQWSINIKKSPDSSMSTPEGTEAEDASDEASKGGMPSGGLSPHMAQFNFGLEPRSQSPISAPVSASAIHFPTQGPFSPGNLRGDQHQGARNPEKISPVDQKRMPSPLSEISDQYEHSALDSRKFLSVRTSSDSSSYEDPDDSENERMGNNPVSRSYLDNVAPLHLRKSGASSMDSVSEPLEPVSPVSPVSPISPIFSERRLDPTIRGLQPLRNPAISPTSPQFSSEMHVPSDDDSPTLPAGPGLSMLVRQHLRNDSSHSSVYAGSTYTRMSRSSRYVTGPPKSASGYGVATVPETVRPSVSGASGSSGGNTWEFDDWEAGYYAEDDKNGPRGPSAVGAPHQPPSIPVRATARVRSEERKDDEESTKERGRAESRFGERDRAMSRASERERSIPAAAEDEHDKDWEQQLAFRRQIIQQNLRNHEKVNSQHEMDFPSENFKDSRSKNGGSPGGFGALRSKGSNGILSSKNDPSVKPLKQTGRDSPGLRKEGRSRMNSDADRRTEEERMLRETVKGPKNIPSVNYPTQQQHSQHHMPPNRPGHLNTNQSPELRTQQRSPIGLPHPVHSPMHTPRLRQKPSREQVSGGQNSSRGQPMGWKDEKDHQFTAPRSAPSTQPSTPTTLSDRHMPQKQPSMPRLNGPEMYRPNQGQSGDRDPRQGRGNPERSRVRENGPSNGAHGPMNGGPTNGGPTNGGPANGGHGVTKQNSFDRDASSDFRRPRGNSNAAPGPTMRQRRGTFDGTQLPPLNTTSLAPAPSPQLQSSVSPVPSQSVVSADKSPAYPQMHSTPTNNSNTPTPVVSSTKGPVQLAQTMTSANALYTPAKKRVIDKSKIGEPKLLSSTSNITTVDLPVQIPPANGKSPKRRMTETRSIFSSFGKNKSTEEVPALPTGSPMITHRRSDEDVERSSFTDDPPPKKKGQGKLRKSTSDGGALGARAKKQEAMTRSPTVPKISKTMIGSAPAGMI